MTKTKTIIITIISVILILILIGAGFYLATLLIPVVMGNGCTLEVQQCADGSFVSRNPLNNCEFNICPTFNGDSSGLLLGQFE